MKTNQILILILIYAVWRYYQQKQTAPAPGTGGSITPASNREAVTRGELEERLGVLESQMREITVATYADAETYFKGSIFRTIHVKSDTVYNDGAPSFYTYNPSMPTDNRVAFFGIDYNYKQN